MNKFAALLLMSCLLSCGSDDGTSGNGVYSSIFTDSAVTAFSQTGGLAYSKNNFAETLFPTANAVSGNISCIQGDTATFDVTALGDTIVFSVTCDSNIDLSIRQELMETMKNHTFLVEYGDGKAAVRQSNVSIPNTSDRQFTVTVENVQSGKGGCFDDMTFNMDTGVMTYSNNQSSSVTGGCSISEYTASANSYSDDMVFRFNEGKIELDFNEDNPQFQVGNVDFVRWCLDDDSNGQCDS